MESASIEYTPTWVIAVVCLIIVVISLLIERGIHQVGKLLKRHKQNALFEVLQRLKDELMLLGFISLLLAVFQGAISRVCVPATAVKYMLPCQVKRNDGTTHYQRASPGGILGIKGRILAGSSVNNHCQQRGLSPLLSLEAIHQLHIFIFVLAVAHVLFVTTTMSLGGLQISHWKKWENFIQQARQPEKHGTKDHSTQHHYRKFLKEHAGGFWSQFGILRWAVSFGKQFCASVSKSDYIALRNGFVMEHCPRNKDFDFHKYMMRAFEDDFKKLVGIRWYLWLSVVIFLLLNVNGWHTYFWLSFLLLILLLSVGAKLEHIIIQLAQEVPEQQKNVHGEVLVRPSDDHFWFRSPGLIRYLIHFILFQNAFEIAFFFWIWVTLGFNSCLMEKLAYRIPRLLIGVIIQVLCSYSTLPLYALVTQMGSMFKEAIFEENMRSGLYHWAAGAKRRAKLAGAKDSGVQKYTISTDAWDTISGDEASIVDGAVEEAITVVSDREITT